MTAWLGRAARGFCSFTGLDYVPYLTVRHFADEAASAFPAAGQTDGLLGEVRDENTVEDELAFSMDLLDHEEQRRDSMERKAFTLLGTTGVATAFVVGFAGLMLDGSKLGVGVFMGCVAVLYFVIVSALLLTILLALRVVEVGTYRFAYPGVDEVRHLGEVPLIVAKRERAGTVLRCFERNHAVVNGKANYLIGAQVWFRNAMVLLFLLATLLAGRAVLGNGPAPGTSTLRGRGAIPAPTEEGPGPQQPPCPADRRGAFGPAVGPRPTIAPPRSYPTDPPSTPHRKS